MKKSFSLTSAHISNLFTFHNQPSNKHFKMIRRVNAPLILSGR